MLKDTEQKLSIEVASTLPVLHLDFDQLKAWADGLTARYADLVVTEEAIADVKRDMAELNKNKAKLEEARKETVKRISEPIRAFETQIKEVCGIFDTAYAKLGSQVKAFEEAQREEKRAVVHKIIANAVCESGYGLTIPVQDKWLNKTTSLKSIQEDVAAIVRNYIEEAQRRKALEQARQDRAAAIESHVHSLNERYGFKFSVSSFVVGQFMNMDTPLAEVLTRIESAFKAEQAKRDLQNNIAVEQKPASVEQPTPKIEQPAPAATTRAMSIVLEYAVSNEAKVQACLATLKTLCVGYGARYR